MTTWGSQGNGDEQFVSLGALAVDGTGDVYVVDTDAHRIQKFDNDGDDLATWGSEGSGDGQFKNPFAVALDAVGNVFVADTGNDCIQKFAPVSEAPRLGAEAKGKPGANRRERARARRARR